MNIYISNLSLRGNLSLYSLRAASRLPSGSSETVAACDDDSPIVAVITKTLLDNMELLRSIYF